ncbi:hypothetical protein [Methylophaga frappieri]|nr:hypothetical protein [Methylophaga frappieri]
MTVFSRLFDICLFRDSPASLPASSQWLFTFSFAYLLAGIAINRMDSDWGFSIAVSLADLAFLLGFCWLLLWCFQNAARWTQTSIALMGTGVFFGVLAMPFLKPIYQATDETQLAGWLIFMPLVILIWALMVVAHILRSAIDCRAGTAVAWTCLYVVFSILISTLVMTAIA